MFVGHGEHKNATIYHTETYNNGVKENLCFIGTKFPHLDTSVKSLHGFGS